MVGLFATIFPRADSMRARGTKVAGPLLTAGDSGALEQNMRTFFDACGAACFNPTDPAYIDVAAVGRDYWLFDKQST